MAKKPLFAPKSVKSVFETVGEAKSPANLTNTLESLNGIQRMTGRKAQLPINDYAPTTALMNRFRGLFLDLLLPFSGRANTFNSEVDLLATFNLRSPETRSEAAAFLYTHEFIAHTVEFAADPKVFNPLQTAKDVETFCNGFLGFLWDVSDLKGPPTEEVCATTRHFSDILRPGSLEHPQYPVKVAYAHSFYTVVQNLFKSAGEGAVAPTEYGPSFIAGLIINETCRKAAKTKGPKF